MVGKSRFGGLFSVLSSRDIAVIRDTESFLMADPDYWGEPEERSSIEGLLDYESEDYPGIENLSIDELIEASKGLIDQLKDMTTPGHFGGKGSVVVQNPESGRIAGKYRYWITKLQPILAKLERVKSKLENESLD